MTEEQVKGYFALAWNKYRKYSPADLWALLQAVDIKLGANPTIVVPQMAEIRKCLSIYRDALINLIELHVDPLNTEEIPPFEDMNIPRIYDAN